MQKIAKFFGIFLTVCACAGGQPLSALAASNDVVYNNFLDIFEDIDSGKFEYAKDFLEYKKGTKNPVRGANFIGQGAFVRNPDGSYSSEGVGSSVIGTNKSAYEAKIETRLVGGYLYVHIKNADEIPLRKRWIKIPIKDAHAFARTIGHEDLMGVTTALDDEQREVEWADGYVDLAVEMDHLVRDGKPYSEKLRGKQTIRVDYALNEATLVPFYKELKKTFTEEELEYSIFGVKGFEKGLKDEKFRDQFVKKSFVSVWINERNDVPMQLVVYLEIPPHESRKERVEWSSYIRLHDIHNRQIVKAPAKNIITMEEALALMELELEK